MARNWNFGDLVLALHGVQRREQSRDVDAVAAGTLGGGGAHAVVPPEVVTGAVAGQVAHIRAGRLPRTFPGLDHRPGRAGKATRKPRRSPVRQPVLPHHRRRDPWTRYSTRWHVQWRASGASPPAGRITGSDASSGSADAAPVAGRNPRLRPEGPRAESQPRTEGRAAPRPPRAALPSPTRLPRCSTSRVTRRADARPRGSPICSSAAVAVGGDAFGGLDPGGRDPGRGCVWRGRDAGRG